WRGPGRVRVLFTRCRGFWPRGRPGCHTPRVTDPERAAAGLAASRREPCDSRRAPLCPGLPLRRRPGRGRCCPGAALFAGGGIGSTRPCRVTRRQETARRGRRAPAGGEVDYRRQRV